MPASNNVVLVLPGGRTFSQSSISRSSRSRSLASCGHSCTQSEQGRPPSPAITTAASDLQDEYHDSIASNLMSDILVSIADSTQTPEERRAQERAKKQRQVGRWLNEVLPSLQRPYLHLVRVSEGLRSIDRSRVVHCSCGGSITGHTLSVICVYFDREFRYLSVTCACFERCHAGLETVQIKSCKCNSTTCSTRSVSLCTSRTIVSRRHSTLAIYARALRVIATKHILFL